jgi:2-haloalkanoic acid dehalogenase type II
MTRAYDYVTFDCYGTLIDWAAGIGDAFVEAAQRDGVRLSREEVLTAHAEIEPVLQAGPYRSYRRVLREVAQRVASRCGWELDEAQAEFLPESLGDWPPFPDTNPALKRLRDAGYKLGILSNVDDDLLAATCKRLTVEFDLLITAEQVGSYKPAPAHFLSARECIADARWLHAAQSWFHDIRPSAELEMDIAWINRGSEPRRGDARPVREFRTMAELADWLA